MLLKVVDRGNYGHGLNLTTSLKSVTQGVQRPSIDHLNNISHKIIHLLQSRYSPVGTKLTKSHHRIAELRTGQSPHGRTFSPYRLQLHAQRYIIEFPLLTRRFSSMCKLT